MATVDKLLIQGVRSFSPQQPSVIEFFKPLTIIVGENGAGKTTTIECLKYACTGSFPPNTKNGQAFVHDPKISGEREVKAKIQLKFHSANQKEIIVTRNLQLTQKPSKLEFKTLDSALQTTNEKGEKVSQDFRCADMDKEIPELMGVNKHILEDVVFCHQEDSNWPLADSTTLKKKFDDIFAATRYTKAIKQIKDERKEYTQKIREMKLEMQNLMTHQETATRLQRDKDKFQKELLLSAEELTTLEGTINHEKERLDILRQTEESLRKEAEEITLLKNTKRSKQSQHQQTTDEIEEEITGADQELKHYLTNFDSTNNKLKNHLDQLNSQLKEFPKGITQIETQLNTSNLNLVKIEDRRNRRGNVLKEKNEKIDSLITRYGLPPEFSDQDLKTNTRALRQTMEGLRQKFAQALENVKQTADSKLESLTRELDQHKKQKNTAEDRLQRGKVRLQHIQNKITQLTNEIPTTDSYDDRVDELARDLEMEKQRLNELTSSTIHSELNQQIESSKLLLQQLEAKLLEHSNSMQELNQQASARVKLDLLKKEIESKKNEFQQKCETMGQELNLESRDIRDLGEGITKAITTQEKTVKGLRSEVSKMEQQNSSQRGQLLTYQEQIESRKRDIQTKRKKIQDAIGQEDFLLFVQQTEQKIHNHEKEINFSKAGEILYKEFINISTTDDICPLCDRGFENEKHLKNFQQELEAKLKEFPDTRKNSENSLQEAKKKLQKIKPLQKEEAAIQQLEQDLPALEQKVQTAEHDSNTREQQITEVKRELEQTEQRFERLKEVRSTLEPAKKLESELQKLNKEFETQRQLLAKLSNDPRSLEDVTKEYENVQKEMKEQNETIDELRKKEQVEQKEIQRRKDTYAHKHEEYLRMKNAVSESVRIQKEIRELETERQTLASEALESEQSEQQVTEAINRVNKQIEQVKNESREQIDRMTKDKEVFTNLTQQIANLEKQLEDPSVIDQAEKEAIKLKEELSIQHKQLVAKRQEIEESRVQVNTELSSAELRRRNVQLNLKWRAEKQELEELTKEIRKKQEALQQKTGQSQSLEEEMNQVTRSLERAKERFHTLNGSRSTIETQIKQLTKELSKTNYKNINEDVRKMSIHLQTMEMTNEDLDKYSKALDKALMKFHSLKMGEINKIIKELWRATYRGNDIDTIEIKSEEGSTQTEKRKTYNYRIVMVKGETELDMRGRCSAGQKVLACLLIRLALAETFCLNCGILALDEPTTNLDRSNVESFANALVQIIESRRKQRNFQLIIITHDEEFVSLLGRSDHADSYWRVTKDPKGTSKIEMCDIQELE